VRAVALVQAGTRELKTSVNSKNDRESPDYRASTYVWAVTESLSHHCNLMYFGPRSDVSQLVSHLVYLEGCRVVVDQANLEVRPAGWGMGQADRKAMGVKTIMIPRALHGCPDGAIPMFTPECVSAAMALVLQ
jgi:hypothetical protein